MSASGTFFLKRQKEEGEKKERKKGRKKRFFSSSFISVPDEDILCQNEMLNVCVRICSSFGDYSFLVLLHRH